MSLWLDVLVSIVYHSDWKNNDGHWYRIHLNIELIDYMWDIRKGIRSTSNIWVMSAKGCSLDFDYSRNPICSVRRIKWIKSTCYSSLILFSQDPRNARRPTIASYQVLRMPTTEPLALAQWRTCCTPGRNNWRSKTGVSFRYSRWRALCTAIHCNRCQHCTTVCLFDSSFW